MPSPHRRAFLRYLAASPLLAGIASVGCDGPEEEDVAAAPDRFGTLGNPINDSAN